MKEVRARSGPAASLAIVAAFFAASCAKDPTYGGTGATGGSGGAPVVESGLPTSFSWTSTGPLIAPKQDAAHPIVSVKDPSIVFFEGRWHIFATTANTSGSWSIIYLSFADWSEAANAQPFYLDMNPNLRGYHAAPQIFYFAPQSRWYLIFQSGQPQYSTNDDLTKPEGWTAPVNFFAGEPPGVTADKGAGFWLDFFTICDEVNCHLFFTDDDGEMFRSQTKLSEFPKGFGDATVAIQGVKETVFEGSMTYRLRGKDAYLTLVEAFGPTGNRYYRSFVANRLDGVWTPLADTWGNPFAGKVNVTFADGLAWTNDVSHGELIRTGHDQTMEVDPARLQLLYQGVDPAQTNLEYSQLPYRLALLTQAP